MGFFFTSSREFRPASLDRVAYSVMRNQLGRKDLQLKVERGFSPIDMISNISPSLPLRGSNPKGSRLFRLRKWLTSLATRVGLL